MAMLILEGIGPHGEELAMAAGDAHGIAVGWDPEFDSATFDADGMTDAELQELITGELASRDPDWESHLRLSE